MGRLLIGVGGFDSYKIDYIRIFHDPEYRCNPLILNGRGERIRTSDPLVPNQVRYQTALRPEICVEDVEWPGAHPQHRRLGLTL